MGDEYKDEILKDLMKMYRDQSHGWVFGEEDDEEIDEDRWSDFDSYSDEEIDEEDDREFATILMDELTENNLDSHILLKYPKIANWWGSVLKERKKKAEALRKREEARRKKEEDAHARESLLARLTPEEKRLLGVK